MAPALADKQHRSPYSPALGLRFLLLAGLSILLLVIDHRSDSLVLFRMCGEMLDQTGVIRIAREQRGKERHRGVAEE